MKPLRLTIQAFGPYPGREVVDFRQAVDSGLFGIYGQTGSGKSTIFSAVTFALFGEPAKSEQDITSLRSDHANAAMTTEVEFVFDLGAKRYIIVRQPDQMRPKKTGSGETKTSHEAHFFDATGLQLEDIQTGSRGKIIAEKKVGVVDEAICQVLGYRSEQFRQIVLLPQGKFETFLASKTKDRLTILRELFDVSLYRKLAERLKEEAQAAENHVKHEREFCARQLADEGFESTEALAAGISESQTQLKTLADAEKVASNALLDAQKEFASVQTLASQFDKAEQATGRLADLKSKSEEMAIKATRIALATKAQSLKDVEEAAIRGGRDLDEARKKLDDARKKYADTEKEMKRAETALIGELGRAGDLQGLNEQVFALTNHKKTVNTASGLLVALGDAQIAEQSANDVLVSLQKSTAALREKQRRKKDQWEDSVKAAERRKQQADILTKLNNSFKTAEVFENALRGIDAASKAVTEFEADFQTKNLAAEAAQLKFDEAERRLSAVQALHLALKLADGISCPVCGSTSHPHPATGKIENEGLGPAFQSAKDDLDAARSKREAASLQLTKAQGTLAERELQFTALEKLTQTTQAINAQLRDVQRILDGVVVSVDPETANLELEDVTNQLEKATGGLATAQGAHNEAKQKVAEASARYQQAISGVPEELRDERLLEAALKRFQADLDNRAKALSDAQKADGDAKFAAVSAKSEVEGLESAVSAFIQRQEEGRMVFLARLAEVELSETEYLALKPAISSIVADRRQVDDYRLELAIAEDASSKASSEVVGLTRPDLAAEQMKLNEVDEMRTAAQQQLFGANETFSRFTGLLGKLKNTMKLLDEVEAASGPLRNLAALCSGANPLRLDLETFAIGAMFDQALQAANLRLMPMTSNRYRLERDIEGSGNGRRGLGIQAFDAYTGKSRATSTLSGGETFIFALSLALGLADVVESASGKIRLDTVFIDEGFGSLDTENESGTLDQVLHALGSLVKKSRAVGLISHVPLVQEAIPNGFYVRKNMTGSTIETRGTL